MKKPTVGQKMFIFQNIRHSKETEIREVVVTKVGRKYFYTCFPGQEDYSYAQEKISLESHKSVVDYGSTYRVYGSKQEIQDEKEADKICKKLERFFYSSKNVNNLSLETLRKIEVLAQETS